MKAQVGDYIKFAKSCEGGIELYTLSQVVSIRDCFDGSEEYNTVSGHIISEYDLSIDDVLLESEV